MFPSAAQVIKEENCNMFYCKKCVMPNTRPGISFNEDGVCSACQSYERRKSIDWDLRWKEFKAICDK